MIINRLQHPISRKFEAYIIQIKKKVVSTFPHAISLLGEKYALIAEKLNLQKSLPQPFGVVLIGDFRLDLPDDLSLDGRFLDAQRDPRLTERNVVVLFDLFDLEISIF